MAQIIHSTGHRNHLSMIQSGCKGLKRQQLNSQSAKEVREVNTGQLKGEVQSCCSNKIMNPGWGFPGVLAAAAAATAHTEPGRKAELSCRSRVSGGSCRGKVDGRTAGPDG